MTGGWTPPNHQSNAIEEYYNSSDFTTGLIQERRSTVVRRSSFVVDRWVVLVLDPIRYCFKEKQSKCSATLNRERSKKTGGRLQMHSI